MSEEEHESSFLSFLAGVGLGAVFGAALALVFAPQSGRQTQEELRETTHHLRERVEKLAAQARETGGRFLQTQQETISRAVRAGREAAAEKRRQLLEQAREEGRGEPG